MLQTLDEAAANYFIDPGRFLFAFKLDPETTLATLLADPKAFGLTRSYMGPLATERLMAKLRAAARRAIHARRNNGKMSSSSVRLTRPT